MMQKNMKKDSEGMQLERFSEKRRVLGVKNNYDLKVRVGVGDLDLLKRELIRKALLFNEKRVFKF